MDSSESPEKSASDAEQDAGLDSVLANKISERFGDSIIECAVRDGHVTCDVLPAAVFDVCQTLRDAPQFAFEQMIDLCGVDFLSYGRSDWETSETATNTGFSRGVCTEQFLDEGSDQAPDARFVVVYQLLSVSRNERMTLRCRLSGEPPRLPSVVDIWNCADWYEREAFDLFGILFEGHPDLRRILTDYGFVGHPFRKDFPLSGYVEVRYDPTKGRVIYEPVSIEPRTLVPRVIRNDHRYHADGSNAVDETPDAAAD
ncbi:MAG: NADH-quinone oxidoreductase subunit C [Gammaproteobacteria bacterium]|jgi:NADH-quinone oxidoreductase subunit C